jgi:ribosomal protein RSM22 (predicted rRNA methylase)
MAGQIERYTATRSQGKQIYYDARKSFWGDSFPHEPKVRDGGKRLSQRGSGKKSKSSDGAGQEADDDGFMVTFDKVTEEGLLKTVDADHSVSTKGRK